MPPVTALDERWPLFHFHANFDLCSCPSKNAIKRDANGKKGMHTVMILLEEAF